MSRLERERKRGRELEKEGPLKTGKQAMRKKSMKNPVSKHRIFKKKAKQAFKIYTKIRCLKVKENKKVIYVYK